MNTSNPNTRKSVEIRFGVCTFLLLLHHMGQERVHYHIRHHKKSLARLIQCQQGSGKRGLSVPFEPTRTESNFSTQSSSESIWYPPSHLNSLLCGDARISPSKLSSPQRGSLTQERENMALELSILFWDNPAGLVIDLPGTASSMNTRGPLFSSLAVASRFEMCFSCSITPRYESN